MRRSRGKRTIALLLAVTVFLTSGFFIAFKMDVFGAKNKEKDTSYQYSDQSDLSGYCVGVRGKECDPKANIILTDEGSNVNGRKPKQGYNGWDPNEYISGSDLPEIPSTKGTKGSKDNPFVILEVVPDKAMQELTYLGSADSGRPFDDGELSASMMMGLRSQDNGNGMLKNIRFTDANYKFTNGTASDPSTFIGNNMIQKFNDLYGHWTTENSFNVFKDHQAVPVTTTKPDGEEEIIYDQNGKIKDYVTESVHLYDAKNTDTSRKTGYNYNRIYNLEITTDDLLSIFPVSWKGDETYKYQEKRYEGNKYQTASDLYYTDDLIALARADKEPDDNTMPTKAEVESFIKNTLMSDEYALGYNDVKSRRTKASKLSNGTFGTEQTIHTTDLIKYNLKTYIARTEIFYDNFIDGDNYGQDVTTQDMADSGEFCMSDIERGITQRSTNYRSQHVGLGISNYWKVRFRKYYVDHFEKLYKDYEEAQAEWIALEGSSPQQKLSQEQENALNKRNTALRKLMKEYEPLFTRRGVSTRSMEDPYDWDSDGDGRMLSKIRVYESDPREKVTDWKGGWKTDNYRAGGYILAVKVPEYQFEKNESERLSKADMKSQKLDEVKVGNKYRYYSKKGDMYLMNDDEIVAKTGKDKDKKSVVFTRDPDDLISSGSDTQKADEKESRKRWVYVPTTWALNGDEASTDSMYYVTGYLDDSNYTMGYASKSFIDKDHYWLAIYDRRNRKFHGGTGFDGLSAQMFYLTDVVTQKDGVWLSRNGKNVYIRYADALAKGYKNQDWADFDDAIRKDDSYTFSYDGKTYTDTRTKQLYGDYSRFPGTLGHTPTEADYEKLFPLDEFHLNVYQEMKEYLGLTSAQETNIKNNNNLINGKNMWPNWIGFVKGFGDGKEETDFLFASRKDEKDDSGKTVSVRKAQDNAKWLTGFCFNFNGHDEVPDVYNLKTAMDEESVTPARVTNEGKRFRSIEEENGETNEQVGEVSDDVQAVSESQNVTEMVKKYSFSYYGFKSNDILKDSLFSFSDASKYNNFHYQVICVTPDEMNQISRKAKDLNAGASATNEKNEDIKLDLIERADMFYFHSHTTKTIRYDKDHQIEKAYKFYYNVVLGEKGTANVPRSQDMLTFYQNDLDWDSVMKLIKRSSLSHGISIPILYNMYVPRMSEEGVDPLSNENENSTVLGGSVNPSDTSFYLYDKTMEWSGTMSNIAKLCLITLQFDLHAKKNSTSVRDYRPTVMETYNPEPSNPYWTATREVSNPNYRNVINSNSGEALRVKRTFMEDIFPYLKQTTITSDYKAMTGLDNTANTATTTGYVPTEGEGDQGFATNQKPDSIKPDEGFVKELTGNGNYERNALDLWNRFTFVPNDKGMQKNDYASFVQQGYLPTYWGRCGVREGRNIFDGVNAPQVDDYVYRYGTTGGDYQNVYVLHVEPDDTGAKGASIFGWYSEKEANAINNNFLNMTFTILSNPGEPDDFEILTKPRKDHKYSILSLDLDQDELLIPFYSDAKRYPSDRLEELKSEKKDILLSAQNSNKDGDYAFIEKVYMQDSSADKKVGDEIQNASTVDIPIDSLYGDKKLIYGEPGTNTGEGAKNNSYYEEVTSEPFASVRESGKKEMQHNVTYTGIAVNGGEKIYIWVPYTLKEFFEDASGSGKVEKANYDRIVLEGHYLFYNPREDIYEYKTYKKVLHISEKELAMLE